MICPASIRHSILLIAMLSLAGCQQSDQAAQAPQESAAPAPDAKPGLSTSDGILTLPVVAGRPGAAYFTLANGSENAVELAAVHVEGAIGAEMHETTGGTMAKLASLPIEPGESIAFARGGKHVMVFDLSDELKPGGTTEMTLSFTDGDKLSAPLAIEDMGGTQAMDHGAGN
ncbi:MAG: copper chaperone PCu(A)C [Novosphingobium sp.]|nr:copper chaperone PCu(A)C [Novosphingobium sp.]